MSASFYVLAWLDSLHATTADGALTSRKWPEAQEARAAVAELIAELRNAHEIIKLAMNHVPADARSKWLLAIDDAGLCGDGVTRFHERKKLLDRVGGAK